MNIKNNLLKASILLFPLSGIAAEVQRVFITDTGNSTQNMVELRKNGYIKEESQAAKKLLLMKNKENDFDDERIRHKYREQEMKYGDTSMQKTISKVPLAFVVKKDFSKLGADTIGAAPAGTTTEDGKWTGVGIYFNKKELGICHYLSINADLSNGKVILDKSRVKYDVNNKATMYYASGEENKGFLYNVEWVDNHYFSTLECASETFDATMKEKVIKLAKEIDLMG